MNDNTNQLFDLISNIQAKLNSNDDNNSSPNDSSSQSTKNNETSSNTNEKNEENNSSCDNTNGFDFSNIDINTILKMQGILSSFNKNSPKKNLLYSLKPFLNQSRQDKLGEYITILSIIDAIDIFGKKGSDKNV